MCNALEKYMDIYVYMLKCIMAGRSDKRKCDGPIPVQVRV